MILCRPGGSVTFFCANIFILLRTTSIPLRRTERREVGRARHTPFIRRVEFQYTLFIRITQQLMGQTVYARRFTNPRHTL